MNLPPLGFDRVVLEVGGKRREIAVSAFFDLPLSERVTHVIQRTVVFYLGPIEVNRHEALAAMRKRAAAASAG